MLPVRLLRVPRARRSAAESRAERAGAGAGGRQRRGPAARGRRSGGRGRGADRGPGRDDAAEREWWELNEEGTILRGERTGAALRLGDRLLVRVARVETVRGRVDLEQAG
jgi:hypothetical protein